VHEQGAVILLDVETEQPFEIEAVFHRDFQLEWPAALGATYSNWAAEQRAFLFWGRTAEIRGAGGFSYGGGATAGIPDQLFRSAGKFVPAGRDSERKREEVNRHCGSMEGRAAAEKTHRHLTGDYADLLKESAEYYRNSLAQTVSVDLPDGATSAGLRLVAVSMVQGMVTNPFLGTGLLQATVLRREQRPGFAWFFGRDSFWTSLALNAEGDFSNSRTALEFISKFPAQDARSRTKFPRALISWIGSKAIRIPTLPLTPTPLYIIAVNDYVVESGARRLAKEKWESLEKAYAFLKSTYDGAGTAAEFWRGARLGGGGPLLPVKTEFYQSGWEPRRCAHFRIWRA